jgi:hypothetical protein
MTSTLVHQPGAPDWNFFVKIDSPLNIEHHHLDYWDGEDLKIVRGEAFMAKKMTPDMAVRPPFIWILYISSQHAETIARWLVVAGPDHHGQSDVTKRSVESNLT